MLHDRDSAYQLSGIGPGADRCQGERCPWLAPAARKAPPPPSLWRLSSRKAGASTWLEGAEHALPQSSILPGGNSTLLWPLTLTTRRQARAPGRCRIHTRISSRACSQVRLAHCTPYTHRDGICMVPHDSLKAGIREHSVSIRASLQAFTSHMQLEPLADSLHAGGNRCPPKHWPVGVSRGLRLRPVPTSGRLSFQTPGCRLCFPRPEVAV